MRSIGFDVVERYRRLLSFYRDVGFDREAKWVSGRLESISSTEQTELGGRKAKDEQIEIPEELQSQRGSIPDLHSFFTRDYLFSPSAFFTSACIDGLQAGFIPNAEYALSR